MAAGDAGGYAVRMRCKGCDYPLWNLRSRQCPECGRAFVPSEFEFVANSVQFCCPSCGQDYYGTGEKGHLVPRTFACVSCHQQVDMDQMVLLPTEGVGEEQTFTDTMPWLDPRMATLKAFFHTVIRAMFDPGRLARTLPAEPVLGRAVWFLVICSMASLLSMVPMMLLMATMAGPGGAVVGSFLVVGAVAAIGHLVFVLIWVGIAHGVLRITGPTKGSMGRTMEVMCYAAAPNLLVAVPCCGLYISPVSWIWHSICGCIMLMQRQGVSAGRAALAVVGPPLVLLLVLVMLWLGLMLPMFQAARVAAQQGLQQATQQMHAASRATSAMQVVQGLDNYRTANDRWPGHALELVRSNQVVPQWLVDPGSERTIDDVPVGPMSLQGFLLLPPDREASVAAAAAASLPADVAAHRLGDFVFTYHGVNVQQPEDGVWLVVFAPLEFAVDGAAEMPAGEQEVAAGDPQATMPAAPEPAFIVIDHRRVLKVVKQSEFDAVLAEQNALRGLLGVPQLSHPLDVTEDKPGRAW